MLLSKETYSAFRLYIVYQYLCSLGIEPTTFTQTYRLPELNEFYEKSKKQCSI